ncbi:response regulator [Pseudonocardia sp. N23]|uniref:response regulator n=1 Tax=Pseudonocardia sp. N23 TaxID=1987376 RepID=UPI000BFBA0F7|nr:response regulator [Pseudonocardia sp. N23]GAY09724.1 two-component system response regulator [Pseudonocardia sp. N23]
MRLRPVNVLLVEDDPGDVMITREAFAEDLRNRLDVATTGTEALARLRRMPPYQDAPRPDLVLLDLNLPGRDGRDVLDDMRSDPELRDIPVVILTSSRVEADIVRSIRLRAQAYITKPVDFAQVADAVRQIDRLFVCVFAAGAPCPS